MLDNKIYDLFKFKVCLWLLIIFIYLLFANGMPWVESNHQLQITKSLIQDHNLSTKEKIFYAQVRGKYNRWYDCHGLTNIYLMAPVVIFSHFINSIVDKDITQFMLFLTALTGVFVNALVCVFFFLILLLFKRPLRICFYSTLCLAFFTIIFPYASTNYEGNLNMLFMLSSLYFLFAFREKKKLVYLIYCGVFTGLAINTRESSLLFLFCVITFIFWVAWKEKNPKIAIIFFAASTPLLITWGYYNWLRTGLFYVTPNAIKISKGELPSLVPTYNILLGLKGLLLSKGGSIFAYSPVLIFSLFGWKQLFRSRKEEGFLILAIIIIFLLANASMSGWFGISCWGPRYTLEITPLMMLPLGYWLSPERLRDKKKKYTFITVCLYSLIVQLSGSLTNWNDRIGHLLERKGIDIFFSTIKYSQWYDSIKILFINLFNLVFGRFLHLENPGYGNMSDISLRASKTIFTWWNRLLIMGINPALVIACLFFILIVIIYCMNYLNNFIKKSENYISGY